MVLSVRSEPFIIPEYSLTGDMLSFLSCPLHYRYQNKGNLPSADPLTLYFGEFIHGFMEEAYIEWEKNKKDFPWDWKNDIRPIELLIDKRLKTRGVNPPVHMFCPHDENYKRKGLCPDENHPHKLTASKRTESMINIWGPHLFHLIDDAEVKLKGLRKIPNYKKEINRSEYYGIKGVVDVVSSFNLNEVSSSNLIFKFLEDDLTYKKKMTELNLDEFEIIIDYKGMKRPALTSEKWKHHEWQVQTYSWLRKRQKQSKPVIAGILFYINELYPSKQGLQELKHDIKKNITDIKPSEDDYNKLMNWKVEDKIPNFSEDFKIKRSIRIITIENKSIDDSLKNFDSTIEQIEKCIYQEKKGKNLKQIWWAIAEKNKCISCDFKSYCDKCHPEAKKLEIP